MEVNQEQMFQSPDTQEKQNTNWNMHLKNVQIFVSSALKTLDY